MKSTIRFLLPVLFVTVCCFSSLAQKKVAKYTDYDRGYYYFYYEKKDSAFLYLNRYINNADDSLKKSWAYSYIARMEWKSGDLYGAQESLVIAIHILDPRDKEHFEALGYAYNLLGNISLDLKQYDDAIEHYYKAVSFFKGTESWFESINGLATVFQKKGEYDKAIMVYDSVLSRKPADQLLVARLTDNRARTKWQKDPGYNALPEFRLALKIRTDSQDNAGLNASYAHLADFYVKLNADSALWYANKMRVIATLNESPDDILEAVDKLTMLSSSPSLIKQWYAAFKKLNDSLQLSRDTTRNRFALIRYDFQKSKADNLLLEQRLTRQLILLYSMIAIALVAIGGLRLWYVKRRNRIRQESAIAIRESKLKTSQKVHDVVANGLYRIMNELEHGKTMEKEPLLDKIEVLYEKSRDISYEDDSTVNTSDHSKQLHNLLMIFNNEQTKVSIVGNEPAFWNKISSAQKKELQLVMGEVMVNMKKHSMAKNVEIIFKLENAHAKITYQDDGIGFSPDSKFGNGLNNTVNRIRSLNGEVNFGKSTEGGVFISISLPLKSKIT